MKENLFNLLTRCARYDFPIGNRNRRGTLRIRTLINFFLSCSSAISGIPALAAEPPHLDLIRLTDHIYVAEDYFYTRENSAVYIGDKDVTVISATWTPESAKLLVQKVHEITKKPIGAVIDTHYHLDRTGGNPYFKKIGAKIIASKLTAALMKKNWDSNLKSAQKDYAGFPSIPLVAPDMTFDDKYEMEGGKIQVLYFGPSHTEDDVVVFFPDEQILFGDCMLKEKLGYLGDANLKEYPKTLERIKKLKIKTIIAGHWTAIHGPELIDQVLELLKNKVRSQ
jgi:metallo-beta-lactamase class B